MKTESKMKPGPSPKRGEGKAAMVSNSCRVAGNFAINVLLELMREAARDGMVKMEDAERVARTVMDAKGPLETFYRQTFAEWAAAHEETFSSPGKKTRQPGRPLPTAIFICFSRPFSTPSIFAIWTRRGKSISRKGSGRHQRKFSARFSSNWKNFMACIEERTRICRSEICFSPPDI